jgi:hypothetical protein
MKRIVLLIFFSFLPALAHDTLSVNLSTLNRAHGDSLKLLVFNQGYCVKIVNDCNQPKDTQDVWGMGPGANESKRNNNSLDDSPSYGVNCNGDYGLDARIAGLFGRGILQVAYAPRWIRHEMTESGPYYVFHSGEQKVGRQLYCFYINGRQIPQSLPPLGRNGVSQFKIDWKGDVDLAKGHGHVFSTLPAAIEFKW